jgi:hypothetical protein
MSNYGANMPPSATAGAYSGNGMPSYGMNAQAGPYPYYPNASMQNAPTYTSPAYMSPDNIAPTYTSPAYTSPANMAPTYTSPAYTSPANKSPMYTSPAYYGPSPMGYSPMSHGPKHVAAGCSAGVILVLYILLLIILRAF